MSSQLTSTPTADTTAHDEAAAFLAEEAHGQLSKHQQHNTLMLREAVEDAYQAITAFIDHEEAMLKQETQRIYGDLIERMHPDVFSSLSAESKHLNNRVNKSVRPKVVAFVENHSESAGAGTRAVWSIQARVLEKERDLSTVREVVSDLQQRLNKEREADAELETTWRSRLRQRAFQLSVLENDANDIKEELTVELTTLEGRVDVLRKAIKDAGQGAEGNVRKQRAVKQQLRRTEDALRKYAGLKKALDVLGNRVVSGRPVSNSSAEVEDGEHNDDKAAATLNNGHRDHQKPQYRDPTASQQRTITIATRKIPAATSGVPPHPVNSSAGASSSEAAVESIMTSVLGSGGDTSTITPSADGTSFSEQQATTTSPPPHTMHRAKARLQAVEEIESEKCLVDPSLFLMNGIVSDNTSSSHMIMRTNGGNDRSSATVGGDNAAPSQQALDLMAATVEDVADELLIDFATNAHERRTGRWAEHCRIKLAKADPTAFAKRKLELHSGTNKLSLDEVFQTPTIPEELRKDSHGGEMAYDGGPMDDPLKAWKGHSSSAVPPKSRASDGSFQKNPITFSVGGVNNSTMSTNSSATMANASYGAGQDRLQRYRDSRSGSISNQPMSTLLDTNAPPSTPVPSPPRAVASRSTRRNDDNHKNLSATTNTAPSMADLMSQRSSVLEELHEALKAEVNAAAISNAQEDDPHERSEARRLKRVQAAEATMAHDVVRRRIEQLKLETAETIVALRSPIPKVNGVTSSSAAAE